MSVPTSTVTRHPYQPPPAQPREEPQSGGALLVAGLDSEAGRELAGLALKTRMQQLQRPEQARGDSLPFLREKQ